LSIKDPEADRLTRELAARKGETLTKAVVVALRGHTAAIAELCQTLNDTHTVLPGHHTHPALQREIPPRTAHQLLSRLCREPW
jgi:hypothetical protein